MFLASIVTKGKNHPQQIAHLVVSHVDDGVDNFFSPLRLNGFLFGGLSLKFTGYPHNQSFHHSPTIVVCTLLAKSQWKNKHQGLGQKSKLPLQPFQTVVLKGKQEFKAKFIFGMLSISISFPFLTNELAFVMLEFPLFFF